MHRLCLALALVIALFLVFPAQRALAGPVLPQQVTLTQPDGTPLDAVPYGDEWDNGYETPDGYTIVQDGAGVWTYAVRDDAGLLVPSGRVPGSQTPDGIAPHLRAADVYRPERPVRLSNDGERPAGFTGTQPVLLLLVSFTNRASVGSTAAQWNAQFFAATNSAKHYYQEVSYGQLTLAPATESHGTSNDGVIGWLNLGYAHPNTAGNTDDRNRQITRNAIIAADPYINFASYDSNHDGYIAGSELHLVVIVAGYETSYGGASSACSPSVWAHQWSLDSSVPAPLVDSVYVGGGTDGGYSQFGEWHCMASDNPGHKGTMGQMVHEMGHDIKWPDLYDTDGSSYGVGYWSIMSSGSWNYVPGGYQGSTPGHPDAFLKWYQGWLTPQQVVGSTTDVQVRQAETNAHAIQLLDNPSGVNWSFYEHAGTGEYFLVENRQKVGYDAGLPGCGLLIWHIDETRTSSNTANASDSRRLVDLEEADGLRDLDYKADKGDTGDPFPGSSAKTTFNDSSNPNSKLYSGAASSVSVTNISNCATTMLADMSAPGSGAPTATRTLTRTATRTPTRTATRTQTPGGPTATRTRTPTRTNTRIPGSWWDVYLPVILSNYPPAPPTATPTLTRTPTRTATPGAAGWVTIMSENFEGSFPAGWAVSDHGSSGGQYTWGKRACRPLTGGFSGWAFGGGANGSVLACGSNYRSDVEALMVYGPFSLAGATDAELRFNYWLNSESSFDEFWVTASIDGNDFYGGYASGNSGGWRSAVFDLTNVYTLGNLAGRAQVWIAFIFTSDGSITYPEGAYLDDIVLEKYMGGAAPPATGKDAPAMTVTPGWMQVTP